jgi:hypothetical protein
MAETTKKPRRRWRKALLGLGVLLLLLVMVVALAPTLVSLGVGRGAIVGALEQHINGTVSIDQLKVGWLGPQSASGISVTGADGRTSADIDLGINAGLVRLLTGRMDTLAVDVSGTLIGELRQDGSTSFEDLLVKAEPRAGGDRKSPDRDGKRAGLTGLPPMTVRIDGVSVELKEADRDGALRLDDLAGALEYEPGGPVKLNLAGVTGGGSAPGSITVAANGEQLFDRDGVLTPDGAALKIDVALERVPVLLSERPTELRALHLTATSEDLADRMSIVIGADAVVDGVEAGRLDADLVIEQPVQPDGTFALDLGRIAGEVTGTGVPTALLQGAFARTPIVVSRDLGPSLDVEARFTADEGRVVEVTVESDAVEVEFSGLVDPRTRSIQGRVFRVMASVHPDLVADVTNLYLDRSAGVEVEIDSFSIPPQSDEPGTQLAGVAAGGTLTLKTPATFAREAGGAALFSLASLVARIDSPALGRGFTVDGMSTVDGADTSFKLSVSGYLADDGSIDFANVVPVGMVSVRNLEASALARFAPGQAELIEAALPEPVDISLTTSIESGEPVASLTAGSGGHFLGVAVTRRGDTLHVANGNATLAVSPPLAEALLKETGQPLALRETATVSIELDPFDVPVGGGPPAEPVTARVVVTDLVLDQVPGLVEPVGVRDILATATLDGAEPPKVSVEGRVRLRRVTQKGPLAELSFDAEAVRQDETLTFPRIELNVSNIAVKRVDQVLGSRSGDLLTWIGDSGSASLTLRSDAGAYEAAIRADFPRIRGEFAAAAEGDVISVTGGDASVSLSREAIERRLAPRPTGDPAGRAGVTVQADVPLGLTVRSLRAPRGLLTGDPVDPADVSVDLVLTGGPLVLDDPQQGRSSIDELAVTLTSDDLTEGVALSISGQVKASAGEPGALEVTGRLTGLVTDGVLTPENAELAMNATASGVHSAVVDALAGWQGLLVAAVGPRMDLTASARKFSRTTGHVAARVETTNGWLDIPRALGRENALRIRGDEDKRASAELEITPPLRERLLSRIHPVLGDIRTTEQPVRATVGGAFIPMDADVSRLRADLDITIGAVEFDSGSVTLAILQLFNASNAKTIPGEIEPIKAKIRKGIVTYEQFAVKIDKYTLIFSGKIDLNAQTVDLRWQMPLDGLALSIRELRGKVEGIVVPLWTHGPLDKPKTDLDPDYKLEEDLLDVGIKTIFEELLKKQ